MVIPSNRDPFYIAGFNKTCKKLGCKQEESSRRKVDFASIDESAPSDEVSRFPLFSGFFHSWPQFLLCLSALKRSSANRRLSAYLDIHRCLEYLGYLGYTILTQQNTQTTAVTVTREKAGDLEKGQTQRSVFLCKVIGPRGTGKSAFLQVFLGQNTAREEHSTGAFSFYTINTVQVSNQEKFLILYEVDVETEFLKASDAVCDVACLMYDTNDPHSFDYCASIYKQHYMNSSIPCVVVASKADLHEVRQLHGMTPAEFCYKHRLLPPLPFSGLSLDSTSKNIYTKLAWAAMFPHLNDSDMSHTSFWLRVTLGAAVVTVLGFAIYRAFT
ncbi:mitochondrial Rho GTPase 2-like [Salvelinus sp. IW2-2015]|uniref:mitochondrial Rho GTPase 2-like n=1 Tax=Salvelinus sp. IW2-2015 TaxID=2691554 RepID=UPI0038D5156A